MKLEKIKTGFKALSYFALFIGLRASCDDRFRYIDGYGQIVARDECVSNGRQAWIMNLDMSQTEFPLDDKRTIFASDTINGVRHDNLVRVFFNISENDKSIFNNALHVKFSPTGVNCPSSRFKTDNFSASETFGYTKL